LPGDITIAVEVGLTEAEYQTTCAGDPIIAYADAECVYDKAVADAFMQIAPSAVSHRKRRCWAPPSPTPPTPRLAALPRGPLCCACRR
jgi:hypothetical protein